MKASKLIEKINNKEIKSGTHIKIWHTGSLKYTTNVWFYGNWFSREPYTEETHPKRYDEIILELCDEDTDYEIVKEPKKMEKLEIEEVDMRCERFLYINGKPFTLSIPELYMANKINEIIDYINKENKDE